MPDGLSRPSLNPGIRKRGRRWGANGCAVRERFCYGASRSARVAELVDALDLESSG